MRDSGALKGQAMIAFELVKENPGKTSKELAKLGTLDRYQLARRLSDLLHAKRVWRFESDDSDCRWFVR